MKKQSRILATLAGLLIASLASAAFAQQPTRLRGTVEKVDGNVLTVKAGEAGDIKITLADNAQIYGLSKATLADIKPNDFIGVGAMPQADGSQKAIQVNIFAESMRGLGEGFRPWDRPGSTMTNGNVDTTVAGVEGRVLSVRYKDGEKKIVVGPDAVIRAYAVSDRNELKPGASVAAIAVKKADGSYETTRVTVGRDGVSPQ